MSTATERLLDIFGEDAASGTDTRTEITLPGMVYTVEPHPDGALYVYEEEPLSPEATQQIEDALAYARKHGKAETKRRYRIVRPWPRAADEQDDAAFRSTLETWDADEHDYAARARDVKSALDV